MHKDDNVTQELRRRSRSVAITGILAVAGISSLALLHVQCGAPSAPPMPATRSMTSGPVAAAPRNLSPLKQGIWSYDVTDGLGKGDVVTQTVKAESTDTAAPWRRFFSADNVIAHLRQQPDGSIVMIANELLDHGVVNTFDPPQLVLPAPQALGEAVTVTSKVVTALSSGPKIKVDHGTSEVTLIPLGTETIVTPAGTFQCQVVGLRVHLIFGLGEVKSTAKLDYADGVGLVEETYNENARTLMMSSTKTRKTVLRSYPH
jgi:hypothetical protein